MAITQIIGTLIGCWLVTKIGKKKLIIIGGQIITIILFCIFIVYSLRPKSSRLIIWLIFLFVSVYSATVGLIPFIYLS